MMKKLALFLLCGFVASVFAQEAGTNLLAGKKWNPSKRAQVTVDAENKVVSFVNPDRNKHAFAVTHVVLNQTEPKTITFSAETKAEDAKGSRGGFSVYLDLTMQDGSKVYGRYVMCKLGTHDWEKAEGTYKPEKPIKSVAYYVLFRHVTGKAQFRNMTLTQEK